MTTVPPPTSVLHREVQVETPEQVAVGYELADGVDYLTVRSLITNPTDRPIEIDLADEVRADGEFKFGHDAKLDLWWCHDEYWQQAYGVQPTDDKIVLQEEDPEGRRPARLQYRPATDRATHVEAFSETAVIASFTA